jgi:hypothetical protein
MIIKIHIHTKIKQTKDTNKNQITPQENAHTNKSKQQEKHPHTVKTVFQYFYTVSHLSHSGSCNVYTDFLGVVWS